MKYFSKDDMQQILDIFERSQNMNNTENEQRFLNAGGIFPNERPKSRVTSMPHMKRILQWGEVSRWRSSKGDMYIVDIVDNHLINIMRYLIQEYPTALKAWNELGRETVTDTSLPGVLRFQLEKLKVTRWATAASFYSDVLPCFDTLSQEIQKRFGNRALRALYDGF